MKIIDFNFFFLVKNLIQNKIKQEKIWTKLLSNAQQTITKPKQTTKTTYKHDNVI